MATVYICDGCKRELDFLNAIRFWGSKVLGDLSFCQSCFESVEKYVIDEYKIKIPEKIKYE